MWSTRCSIIPTPLWIWCGQAIKNFRKRESQVGSLSLVKEGLLASGKDGFMILTENPGNAYHSHGQLHCAVANILDPSHSLSDGWELSLGVLCHCALREEPPCEFEPNLQPPKRKRPCQELSKDGLPNVPQLLRKQNGPSPSITINGLPETLVSSVSAIIFHSTTHLLHTSWEQIMLM